jgi:phage-related baseplate assembly protein
MMHTRAEVVASVEAIFPKSAWARVLDLLDSYGVESDERERERVQLAILKLSAGSEEKVREYAAVAKRDYRDVLFWAEYPEESRLDTPAKRQRVRKMFEKFGIESSSDL